MADGGIGSAATTSTPPPPDLADAVEALWTHETVGLVIHRVVPDAAVSLCFMGTRALDGPAGASRLRLIGPEGAESDLGGRHHGFG